MDAKVRKKLAWLGIEQSPISHQEKWISALGGGLSIALIYAVSQAVLPEDAYFLVASMGASAVLLFAVPNGALSQPWPLLVGHLVSALAVGLAVLAMTYLRAIHPPGGATALTAAMGSEGLQQLGYQFLFTPVLLNVLIILSVAVLFNALFHWRRYPSALAPKTRPTEPAMALSHSDFLSALKAIDSFVDVNEQELKRIFDLAYHHAQSAQIQPEKIQLGHYYTNGGIGKDWAVRQVIDLSEPTGHLIYKQLIGSDQQTGYMTLEAFALWAKHEIKQVEGRWQRVDS